MLRSGGCFGLGCEVIIFILLYELNNGSIQYTFTNTVALGVLEGKFGS